MEFSHVEGLGFRFWVSVNITSSFDWKRGLAASNSCSEPLLPSDM